MNILLPAALVMSLFTTAALSSTTQAQSSTGVSASGNVVVQLNAQIKGLKDQIKALQKTEKDARKAANDDHEDKNDIRPCPPLPIPDVTAPVIHALTSAANRTTARIHWTTNEPSTGKLHYATTTPVNVSTATSVSSSTGPFSQQHTVELSGLTANTKYFFLAEAKDTAGNTTLSAEGSFMTQPADAIAPLLTAVATTVSDRGATIRWNTNEQTTGSVFVSASTPVDKGAATTRMMTDANLKVRHEVKFGDLAANTTYYFVIEMNDGAGNLTVSSEHSFKTNPGDAIAPILTNISYLVGSDSATLRWRTTEASTSAVFYSTTSPLDRNATSTITVRDNTRLTNHMLQLKNLSANTAYYFAIESTDAAGNAGVSTTLMLHTSPS